VDAPGLVTWITSMGPLQLDIRVGPRVMVGETTPTSLNESKILPSARRIEFSLKEPTTNLLCMFACHPIQPPSPSIQCYEDLIILIYATALGQICKLFLKLCIVFCRCLSGTGFSRHVGVRRLS